jgi:small conductance mechanosensitive channel
MPGLLQFPVEVPDPLAPFSQFLIDLFAFTGVSIGVYLVARLLVIPPLLQVIRRRNRNNPTLITATETYLQVLSLTLATLTGLAAAGQLGFLARTDTAIIIAALAFAFSIVGQEVFGSLVSGFFLVADPDFNVGDFISWSGGQGVVEAVDFRVTRIRTPDHETITVPNTELATNALTRPFGRDRFRITERAFVSYDEDTERALLELQQIAANHEEVLADPAPSSRIVDLGPDSITVRAEFWIGDPFRADVVGVRSDFRREVKLRFDEEELTLAPAAGRELSGSVAVERTES